MSLCSRTLRPSQAIRGWLMGGSRAVDLVEKEDRSKVFSTNFFFFRDEFDVSVMSP